MNPQEKVELTRLIALLRDRFGVGIWLIEHDMKLVMSICQRITVLDHGETIAVGQPRRNSVQPQGDRSLPRRANGNVSVPFLAGA